MLDGSMDEKTIYDYIRMLDGEGYPNAFIRMGDYELCFYDAEYDGQGEVTARVRFRKVFLEGEQGEHIGSGGASGR